MNNTQSNRDRVACKQAELAADVLAELDRAVAAGHAADRALARLFRKHREWGSRDRRFFSNLVFSFFRWRGWLVQQSPTGSQEWARSGAIAWLLDALTIHPAVEVMLSKAGIPQDSISPLGAVSLERKAEALVKFGIAPTRLTPGNLTPAWMADELEMPEGVNSMEEARQAWIQWLQSRPPLWLRLRPGREKMVETALAQTGLVAHGHASASALHLEPGVNLEILPVAVRSGFEIQDINSQAVGLFAAPKPGEKWWDVCAGAGGKTLHLQDLADGQLSILATDARAGSIEQLRQRARHAGIKNITAQMWDGKKTPGELFDGVLLDAPCTGSGTWHRNPDGRWRLAQAELDNACKQQAELLLLAASRVRPGGWLVYATCSVFRRENSAQIQNFITERPDFKLDSCPHPFSGKETNGAVCFPPGPGGGNGMYMCRLRRI